MQVYKRFHEPAPSFGASIRTDFIAGMGKVKGQRMILLDVERVLSIEELSVVGDVRANRDADNDQNRPAEVH